MKTKNLLILLITFPLSICVKGQQFPYFNHVYLNQITINPALTGMSGQANLLLIQKNTLTGIPGNPKTLYLNASGPVKNNTGIGLNLYRESLGITSKTAVYGSYAYRLRIDETQSLNFGFSVGALQFAIDPDMAEADNANDPLLVNKNFRSSTFDGSLGAFYKNNRLEAGLSVLQVFGKKTELTPSVNFNLEKNVVGSFKYNIPLNPNKDFTLSPMIIARYSKTVLPQEMLFIFNYRDRLWFVPSYSTSGLFGMAFSVKLYNSLNIGYANEMYIKQPVSGNQRGGHEIMVSYSFDVWSKTFKKQQNEIDDLYERLKDMDKRQLTRDSLQDEAIKETGESADETRKLLEKTDETLKKTKEDLEKLKKQLMDAGLIREFSISEYDSTVVAGYYIVIASVSEVGYSQKAMDREFINLGYKQVFNKKRGWHYVYTVKPDDFASALKILKETRAGKHKDAWIHILK